MRNEEMSNGQSRTDMSQKSEAQQREELITQNMGYVVTLARQYQSDILSTDDLVSEGSIGLIKAAEKYDASRGKPFVTFAAPYIRHSIEEAIRRLTTTVDTRSTDESLPRGSRNNYTLLNVLEDTNAPKTDALLEENTLSEDLLRVIGVLNERERRVVDLYYGNGYERQTMAEIGEVMQLKRERVRQIRDLALRKLKKAARALVVLILLFSFLPSSAKLIKVLAIGNSFSEDAVEQYLYELAAAQGDSLVIGNAYIPACSIEMHLDNLKNSRKKYAYRKIVDGEKTEEKGVNLQRIILDEPWDIITLQQASLLSGLPDTYKNLPALQRSVKLLATNPKVDIWWHMTWAYAKSFKHANFEVYGSDQQRMFTDIVSCMRNEVPKANITQVIPSGTAIRLMRYRKGDTLNRDGYHLSYTIGRYTVACTWCEMLTGRIVDGNSYRPASIKQEDAKTCQQEAHEAVFMQQLRQTVNF
ncbi:MAG: sigma-70 family RNA polymerase sigma factor [Prevotella sp.]|nr:sigma-70 family RNA polymerase sigma factor [Prevotella sp.]